MSNLEKDESERYQHTVTQHDASWHRTGIETKGKRGYIKTMRTTGGKLKKMRACRWIVVISGGGSEGDQGRIESRLLNPRLGRQNRSVLCAKEFR